MEYDMKERILAVAEYVAETGCTVRAAAEVFDVSKSTVHTYLGDRLKSVDGKLYGRVRKVLEYNLSVRHIRGGATTKKKYAGKKRK